MSSLSFRKACNAIFLQVHPDKPSGSEEYAKMVTQAITTLKEYRKKFG
ncbi:MAG: hypothetical protein WAM28_06445 [Chlamydiales bacterium]